MSDNGAPAKSAPLRNAAKGSGDTAWHSIPEETDYIVETICRWARLSPRGKFASNVRILVTDMVLRAIEETGLARNRRA